MLNARAMPVSLLARVQLQNFQSLQKFRLDSRCGNVIRSKPANPSLSPFLLLNRSLPSKSFSLYPSSFVALSLLYPHTVTKLLFFFISPKSIFVVCVCVCGCVYMCVRWGYALWKPFLLSLLLRNREREREKRIGSVKCRLFLKKRG